MLFFRIPFFDAKKPIRRHFSLNNRVYILNHFIDCYLIKKKLAIYENCPVLMIAVCERFEELSVTPCRFSELVLCPADKSKRHSFNRNCPFFGVFCSTMTILFDMMPANGKTASFACIPHLNSLTSLGD